MILDRDGVHARVVMLSIFYRADEKVLPVRCGKSVRFHTATRKNTDHTFSVVLIKLPTKMHIYGAERQLFTFWF